MAKHPLIHSVRRFIEDHRLIRSPGPLVVGVSGGPDSVCLLHVLYTLKEELGIEPHMAHLNHRLRGAESDADEAYARKLGQDLGVPVTIESREVRAYQSARRCSLEEAAREVRYTFLADVAKAAGADAVAVAHTANDQAETILLHLIRGTGLAGLKGMRPLSRWNLPDGRILTLIRPLLETPRTETEAYCAAHHLSPRRDSSNLDPRHLRNRIRSELLPLLEAYNPRIIESLCRTGRILADDLGYIQEQAERAAQSVLETLPEGVSIDRQSLSALPPALRRHVLRAALEGLVGKLRDIESVHIEALMEALVRPPGTRLSLPYGLTFYGDYVKSTIVCGENPPEYLPPLAGEHRLCIPGETIFPGWRVKARILERTVEDLDESPFTAYMDMDQTGAELRVRTRREGDRFQPLGMSMPKKLQDFMTDAKIPRGWRDRVPLVCAGGQIAWVVGWRIAHPFRVTDSTRRILEITFEMD